MSTIIIGVDASERSQDAIAFGGRLIEATGADAIVACAFPYLDGPSRAAAFRQLLRDDALDTTERMRDRLEGAQKDRVSVRVVANPSPAHALHDLAESERATLIVVGSTHSGRAGRVLPGSTAERLLHGSPCAVAVVPSGYRLMKSGPIRRIGVAFNGTAEARAAAYAAAALARAFDAKLDVIGVVSAESFATPGVLGAPSMASLREEMERAVQRGLEALVEELGDGVSAQAVGRTGSPADLLEEHSLELDLLVCGSRGYGPLWSVLVGGVSGRVLRDAACPVVVVPRGVEAPLGDLLDGVAAVA